MEDFEICAKCGGRCCKWMPGEAFPEDVLANFPNNSFEDAVEQALDSGMWVMDNYNGPLVLRPRGEKDHNEIVSNRTFGPNKCGFLTESGCKLKGGKKPRICRELVPKVEGGCEMAKNNKKELVNAWKGHQAEMKKVYLYKCKERRLWYQ